MIVNEQPFVMLLTQPFFKTFTRRDPCDTSQFTEECSQSRAKAGPRWTRR